MALKNKTHEIDKATAVQRAPQQIARTSNEYERPVNPAIALQRATSAPPAALRPADILALQRTVGNRAVLHLLSRRPSAPPAEPSSAAVQRKTEDEETLRGNSSTVQRRESRTGLPDELKAGIENLSGVSLDDVRVHYNSSNPSRVRALAYTQGANIHVAPGQERHLAHEAWHVVQQKQGRVGPTGQLEGMTINDDARLEQEADEMSAKALQAKHDPAMSSRHFVIDADEHDAARPAQLVSSNWASSFPVAQLEVSEEDLELWREEHNQTIALESGSKEETKKSVELDDGNIVIKISEHASHHFCNRHTIKEFSFKDENIKSTNSFWERGTGEDDVLEKAESVIKGLEEEITPNVKDPEGDETLMGKKKVGELNVGYKISLAPDADTYDEDEGEYAKGTGQMVMFYPEGEEEYKYFKEDDLKEIKEELEIAAQ